MNYSVYPSLAQKALGNKKCALVLKNCNIINVFSEEIIKGDIAIENETIVGIGTYFGEVEIDLENKYVAPGFIDAHLHLESTLVSPPELVNTAMQCGTTTFVVDPHEAVNVAGENGLNYIISHTEDVLANVYIMLPSCVPSAKGEDNGCLFTAEKMKAYLAHPRVLGLGEVMDTDAVFSGDDEMMKKLKLFSGKSLDGHAPSLSDKEMNAYVLAGITSDHECSDFEHALMEIRAGLQVFIREGSGARNLEAIVQGILKTGVDTAGFSFCTDDKHIDDIRREGHISHNVRQSIQLGLAPIKAIKMASINTARHYGLNHLGAVAAGYQANLVVLDDLNSVQINSVYCKGKKFEAGAQKTTDIPIKPILLNTIHFNMPTEKEISLAINNPPNMVIKLLPGQITTQCKQVILPKENGQFKPNSQYNKCIVVERHKNTGKIGIAPVAGFNLSAGAIATSVAHDSHNIIAIGDNDADILMALKEVKNLRGAYVLVSGGKVYESVALPVMGLISHAGFDIVDKSLVKMIAKAHEMGVPAKMDPFITLSFIALTAIPEIRITTNGIWHINTNSTSADTSCGSNTQKTY